MDGMLLLPGFWAVAARTSANVRTKQAVLFFIAGVFEQLVKLDIFTTWTIP
jgi:hypothetical protein